MAYSDADRVHPDARLPDPGPRSHGSRQEGARRLHSSHTQGPY